QASPGPRRTKYAGQAPLGARHARRGRRGTTHLPVRGGGDDPGTVASGARVHPISTAYDGSSCRRNRAAFLRTALQLNRQGAESARQPRQGFFLFNYAAVSAGPAVASTNSMKHMGAASPRRGPIFTMRV